MPCSNMGVEIMAHELASSGDDFVTVQVKIRDLLAQVSKNNPKLYMEYITEDMGNAIVKAYKEIHGFNNNHETDKGVN